MNEGFVLAALAACVAIVVASCGGDAEPMPTLSPTPAPTVAPAGTATPASAATAIATLAPTPSPTTAPIISATQAPATATSLAPKFGGVYRTSLASDPRLLYPLKFNLGNDTVRLQGVMNGLVQWDPYSPKEENLLPILAESWSVSQDGRTFNFKLRNGIRWHDGRPLTMDDVLFSMRLAATGHLRPQLLKMSGFEAVDPTTLKVSLSANDPDFLTKLTQPHMMITPSHLTEEQFRTNPIGTGPFKWSSHAKGVSTKLVRNDSYFQKPRPYLDGVEMFIIPDTGLGLAAFRAGRLERTDNGLFPLRSPSVIAQLKREIPGVNVHQFASGFVMLIFNNVAPWTDQRVRKAFHLSVDRVDYNTVYNEGTGYPWAGNWYAPALGGHTGLPEQEMKNLPGYRQSKDQDWAEAKRLLQEAGVDGGKLVIDTSTRAPYGDALTVITQQVIKGGFTGKFNITERDSTAQREQLEQRKDFSLALDTFGPLVDMAEAYIPEFWLKGGQRNYAGWENPKIVELNERQINTLDQVARSKILHDIYREAIEWAIAPSLPNNILGVAEQPYVRNFPIGLTGYFNEWNRFDQVWLDKS